MVSGRLLIVSNRLPVGAQLDGTGAVGLTASSGGLATGMRPWHERSGGLWIGWPGDISRLSPEQQADFEGLLAERAIVPVPLSQDHVNRYYHGFANRVLWPLFHYLIDRVPVHAAGWDAYRQVNQAFADVVAREYRRGDAIWVHDYQLMLVPRLLRERLPQARIGFFLHIPFPSSEVFRTLPWRREVLDGLLGADLVGFHTFAYLRHFVASLLHVEGVEADIDRVRTGDREVRLGAFPMGIDAAAFAARAAEPAVVAKAAAIREDAGGRRILLGVDRLDYTKGIPRRLQAIERLLARHPELRDTIRFIQVAVPSREEVDQYQRFRRLVEEAVGRINGSSATLRSTPIHYVHQSVSMRDLVALYLAADIMLVTPLRDGMNLVSKEFLASRIDDDGVLVLSEFAGAASELGEAVVVNPYDVDAVAETIQRALGMPGDERRARMRALRRRVFEYDIHAWADSFMQQLMTAPTTAPPAVAAHAEALAAAISVARETTSVRLLLDYDGTLVPLAANPDLAEPDGALIDLLRAVSAVPRLSVELVSGRPRETLDNWFGRLPIHLWAEHGFWQRRAPREAWRPAGDVPPGWMSRLDAILRHFTDSTPGSFIEEKTASVAWHYRGADPDFGARQAHELRMLLGEALSNQPLEVLEGKKVVEVRYRSISKAVVADRSGSGGATVVVFGDDRSDEELFSALPDSSITVAVGEKLAGARWQVPDHHTVREILRSVIAVAERADARR
jgi:trehalose 6-phosphate synthase/phosphatase